MPGRPFYEIYALIEENRLRAQDEIARIDRDLLALSNTWYQELVVIKKLLETINSQLGAYRNFGVSDYMFVIMGWIPKKNLNKTRKMIENRFSDRVIIHELPVTEKDMENAPVFYDNPPWVKPFEFIMQLVAPPRYREVDPTPILAIFFPLFFGIMVGDVGYGLVILAFALVIRHRFQAIGFAKNLANILIISSIPAIIFGFLFGEFFGDLGENLGWLHPVQVLGITWNRVDAMIPMLILAITIGIIHVFLGLFIGIRNAIITKKRKHLYEKTGMLLMITAIIVLVAMLAKVVPAFSVYPAVVLIVVALPLILMGAGVFGTIEVMSTVGNILSYSRLMAIGMASVILAMVANRLQWCVCICRHRDYRRTPAARAQCRACHVFPFYPRGASPPCRVLLEVLRGGRDTVQAVQERSAVSGCMRPAVWTGAGDVWHMGGSYLIRV